MCVRLVGATVCSLSNSNMRRMTGPSGIATVDISLYAVRSLSLSAFSCYLMGQTKGDAYR